MSKMHFYIFLFVIGVPFFSAAGVFAQAEIFLRDGKRIRTSEVAVLGNGDLEFLNQQTKTKMKIPNGQYSSVKVPKPQEILTADSEFKNGKFAAAATLYRNAWMKYRHLGWNVYCILMESDALIRSGNKDAAFLRLQRLEKDGVGAGEDLKDYLRALFLSAELAMEKKDCAKAERLLDTILRSYDAEYAAAAFLKKGDLLRMQAKNKEASISYFQAVLLFPESTLRPEALYKTWETLTLLKDKRADKFADVLRREYPENPFAKKLPK